ncbi:type II toxin-antitoxin system VapC family toxin [Geobacter sp. SVR]|uniref:type II toxin-antitoxin system VapC family toxin n=1 Tax=Geobacter sp. SVR TaxID=2495594 RepID=UPI00143F00E2|nr:type II toxin-antitoxin system VapC family toxin [Geobacter sp. SVR]BCS53610.1 twitching motility protein PilT [Geobacter sp. SVR]GCF84193.1 twitching motility protein PilT [Geobacter sp. SVR]
MRLLLDTHVALWAITDSPALPEKARRYILAPHNEVYVSAVSIWEIAIKHGLGRGNMPVSGREAADYFSQAGYLTLDISAEHAAFVEELPNHHADPFDRMLVAQALYEPMHLLTHDKVIAAYSDVIILV